MLKFTSLLGSVRAITDITLTGTTRTRITDLIIDPITGRTTGTVGIVIIAIITVIPIITGASLTGIATPGWLEAISSQPNFFLSRNPLRFARKKTGRSIFLTLAKPPVWSQSFFLAHRSEILFSIAE